MTDKPQKAAAIIVAAGESRRMEGIDKVLATLGGQPLLLRATRPFQECPQVGQIVVVVSGEKRQQCRHLVSGEEWSKVSDVCIGGERRQDSVAAGLALLEPCDWVIVHDAARPLVTRDIIERGLAEAEETGAAAAAIPVTDTIKVAGDDRLVTETLSRRNLEAVQTPQVFRFDIINEAHRRAGDEVTDDATLVERLGHRVKLYMGSYENIKVTTPADLVLAEVLWRERNK